MKYHFVNRKEHNHRLILVFSGWSCDYKFFETIDCSEWDVLVCYDFDDFDFDKSLIVKYHTIYLYAWSLGVFAADRALSGVALTQAVAINGTLTPIDDEKGIPETIFYGTLNRLDARNLKKFRMRMFADLRQYSECEHILNSDDNIPHLCDELKLVDRTISENSFSSVVKWSRVFISECDRIFPADNQKRAWSGHQSVTILENAAHVVDFCKIILSTIVNKNVVSRHFERSHFTYNSNATAQQRIAERLTNLIVESKGVKSSPKILEIGCGTGLFTQCYFAELKPSEVDFVDLYDIVPFGLSDKERYHKADAEKWIEQCDEKFDCILSASSVQWFSNIKKFIDDCSHCMRENSLLAISTFAPGNLCELDAVRISPINYLSQCEWTKILEHKFSTYSISKETIELEFDSPESALKHLKLTGVTASETSSIVGLRAMINKLKSECGDKFILTYKPMYILAKK